jgi:hypothetical protein
LVQSLEGDRTHCASIERALETCRAAPVLD